jgi:hypothetical protein
MEEEILDRCLILPRQFKALSASGNAELEARS